MAKQIKVVAMESGMLKRFDYVVIDNELKPITQNAYGVMYLNHDESMPRGRVYVIRGYRISCPSTKWTCPVCNGKANRVLDALAIEVK